jgi:beta-glucosidase
VWSILVGVLVAGPRAAAVETVPFRDPALPLATRVDDLISRLTLDEKISLLHQYQPAITRLGIGAFRTGTEALHGVAWLGPATVFPQAIGLGSTWDPDLVTQVGAAVGTEARGFNARSATGLNVWAPTVNLLRDPRWGRNEEGYSEDPFLTGAMSTAYGRGLQGDHATYLRTAPTLKHYLAYNNETRRDVTDAMVPPRQLRDYEQAAFRPAITAGAATGVMPGYNLVNGRPSTVDPDLNAVVRRWTGNDLMIVSDAFAPANLVGSQRYHPTQIAANAAAVKAGLDSFTQDDANPGGTTAALRAAVDQGLLTASDIETADRHVLSVRFRLGEFDPAGANPYAAITPDVINSPAHRQLARRAAAQQMVLLRNEGNLLPLSPGPRRIAVVGPLSTSVFQDFYSGTLPYAVTPLQGITERLPGTTVTAAEGIDRIALRAVSTGRYVTAGTGTGGATLTATATTIGTRQGLDIADWGQGVSTIRAAANGRYVTLGGNRTLVNSQTQPNGWYVEQLFKLEPQSDGSVVIRFVGYNATESWFGPNVYVTMDASGTLRLGAATPASATRFTREIVTNGRTAAVAAATGADAVVIVAGSNPMINARETVDRQTMALPTEQDALIRAVRQANPNTVVVLQTSYPETITWAQANVPSILWSSHAGQETGHGLADVLLGDYNPTGRLTQTWYRADSDLPSIFAYDIARSGMTYQHYRGTPLYPFGHGLSYTSFGYSRPTLSNPSVTADGTVTVTVDVTNTGARAGTEVVQMYTRQRTSRASGQPLRQLRAFSRVSLAAGERKTVNLTLKAADLAFWDVTRSRPVVESGTYDILLGTSAASTPASLALTVTGETIPARQLTGPATPAATFDDYNGVSLVDTTRAAGTAVAATASGQWIKFGTVAWPAAASSLTANVSRAGGGAATIQVRLDNPTSGPLLGTVPVPDTADRRSWRDVRVPLRAASGQHDVYLVFTGPAALNTITVSLTPPTPPADRDGAIRQG